MNRRYTPPPRNVRRSAETRFRAASEATCAIVSNSERPSGRARAGMRSERGMSTRRSSIELTPIAASIAARSSGECTRYGTSRLGLGDLLVGRLVEQIGGQLAGQLQLQDPAFAIRVGVDQLGGGGQLVVHRRNTSGHRRVQVACSFDRLDHTEGLAFGQLAA